MPIASSQGTTFTYGGSDFVAKNVKVKVSGVVDISSLATPDGGPRDFQAAPLQDTTITCEYWGDTAPSIGTKASISCQNLGISGQAVCEDFEITAAAGELLVGNATFRLCAT